jgi:hypothetical protein
MYSMESYKQMHRRAVERIGLTVGKLRGTTPHGHRHAYGRRLTRAGVDPVLRKKALHHKALASQAVYTAPNMAEVARALSAAAVKLDELVVAGRVVTPSLDTSKLPPRVTMVVASLDLAFVGSGLQIVVVGGCGACGRRSARWVTRSVIHGKPAGARSASSTNTQPDAAPMSAGIPDACFNNRGAMREHFGTIRTNIQRQSGGAVVATGERSVGGRFA